MPTSRTTSYWQTGDKASAFVQERRALIPLIAEQEEVCRLLLKRGREVERFLDLGCGAGAMTGIVLDVYPGARGTLLDFSDPMLDEARRRYGGHDFRSADVADPSWANAIGVDMRFDAIISGLCIHHLTDERKRSLFGEIFDLLEPGGVFVNLEHVSAGALAAGVLEETFIARLAEHAHTTGRDPDQAVAAYRETADEDILAGAEQQCGWLREIGFEAVDQYCRWFELAVFAGVKPTTNGGR